MKQIHIKGAIVSNDDKWFYDWLDMDATAPKDIVLPETGEAVEVIINSGGGDVYAGSEIYTVLRSYAGQVTVKVVGIAASAASVIAMAGDVVEISPTAQLMIHNVSVCVQGDHRTLSHEADVLEGFNQSIANAYLAKTGKSMEDLLALMAKETWFTAENAVAEGFADKVMFENDMAPKFTAAEGLLIPSNIIEKFRSAIAGQKLDIDELAKRVADKLAQEKKQEEVAKATNQGFGRFLF